MGHMKNKQVAGNSQHGLSKDKTCLTPCLPSVLSGSVNKRRVLLINKGVKWRWSQHWPLSKATGNQLPAGLCTSDHKPLSPAIQPAFHPPYGPLTRFSSLALRML